MAQHFSAEVRTSWAQTRVFDYLVDFRHLPEWHPAVSASELRTLEHAVRNARYRLTARIAGRQIEPEVVVVELERPTLIVATAENAAAKTTDRFDLSPTAGEETSVVYRSELRLTAPLAVIGPFMVPALTAAWGTAVAGLERVFSDIGPA